MGIGTTVAHRHITGRADSLMLLLKMAHTGAASSAWGEVTEQPSGNPVWAGTLPGVQPRKPLLHLLNGDDVLVGDVVGAGSVVAVLQGSEVSVHRVQEVVDCVAKVLCAAAADTVHHALQPRCLAANSSHLPDTPPSGLAAASRATDLAGEVYSSSAGVCVSGWSCSADTGITPSWS